MNRIPKKLRGATILELMLWLALLAILFIAIFSNFGKSQNNVRINKAKTEIQTYVSQVQQLYVARNDYQSVDTQLVIDAGLAPSDAVAGTQLINPWGGNTDVTGALRTFTITMDNIPSEACVSMLAVGLIDQGTIISQGANGVTYDTELDPSVAIGACSSATNNTISFTAR